MLTAVTKLMGQQNQEIDNSVMNRFEKLKSRRATDTNEMKKENLIDKIRPRDRYQLEQDLHEQIRSNYQEILLQSCILDRKTQEQGYWDGNWGV